MFYEKNTFPFCLFHISLSKINVVFFVWNFIKSDLYTLFFQQTLVWNTQL